MLLQTSSEKSEKFLVVLSKFWFLVLWVFLRVSGDPPSGRGFCFDRARI